METGAKFSPRKKHIALKYHHFRSHVMAEAIKRLGRYLPHTRKEGIVYSPDTSKGLEFYEDKDFAGGWQEAKVDDADNVMSRTRMVIMYDNCPIFWRSSRQTKIALSTAEVEYIALSSSMRQVLLLMTIME